MELSCSVQDNFFNRPKRNNLIFCLIVNETINLPLKCNTRIIEYMSYKHISKVNRLEISILLNRGYSIREIGRALGKNPSSISREIKKNKVKDIYDPAKANHKARVRRLYSKYEGMKIISHTELRDYVEEKLQSHYTPEEIAGRLKRENNGVAVISAKSIYKFLYSVYGRSLCKYLPSQRQRPRKRGAKKQKRQIIPNRISIEERPDIVDERIRFGDFEGDTLGRPKGEQETLVGAIERKTRFFLACKVSRLKYSMDGFKKILNPYHSTIKSLTLDNGVENSRHQELNVSTYFCHPYSSWEKPGIENTFGRLRRFIPKKASLKNYTEKEISDIINLMNNTPRKCLDYRTPQEAFLEELTNTSVALGGIMYELYDYYSISDYG